jgi:spore coat protein CotH
MKYILAIVLLFPFTLRSQNTKGDILFQSAAVHEIYLDFSQTGFWDSLTANYTTDTYMKCNVTIDGLMLPSIGAKLKGNSSYNNPSIKKSFKLDLNEYITAQDYDGLKKLNLNNCFKDPSFMREKLMLDFCNHFGIPAPRCTYAKVYLNNTYWGLYTIVEETNNAFLDRHFFENDGNIFKGDPTGDLKWLSSTQSNYYNKYELHSNETLNDWSDLVNLIDEINNTPIANWADSVDAVLNIQSVIKAWAACAVFADYDSYAGSGHNYFLYHNLLTNKFEWIVWDVNEGFGNFTMNMQASQIENSSMFYISNPANRPLYDKLLQVPEYKSQYTSAVCEMVDGYFNSWVMDPKIDSLANKIRAAVYADPNKFYSNQQFEDNLSSNITQQGNPGGALVLGLKSFIVNRRSSLVNELVNYNCTVGLKDNLVQENALTVYPNPVSDILHLNLNLMGEPVYVLNAIGELIISTTVTENHLVVSALKPGFYFLRSGSKSASFTVIR